MIVPILQVFPEALADKVLNLKQYAIKLSKDSD